MFFKKNGKGDMKKIFSEYFDNQFLRQEPFASRSLLLRP